MDSANPTIALTLDPAPYLSMLSQAVEDHLGGLRVALRSLEDGSFKAKAGTPQPGTLLKFSFELSATPENAVAQLCNRCFVSVVGELVTYLDRMIAFRRCTSKQVTLPGGVSTKEAVLGYVKNLLDQKYAAVARDTRLTNPKKLAQFPGIAPIAHDSCLSYFAIRRCLEHHGGRSAEDLTLWYGRLKLLAGDMEITREGQAGPPDAAISLGMDHTSRLIPAGAGVVLTETELEHVVFTVQCLIGPEIRRVTIGSTAHPPTPTPEVT
jgi:hypothetical protein